MFTTRKAPTRSSSDDKRKKDDRKPRFFKKKVCKFCTEKMRVDYKEPDLLLKFMTEKGKIVPRRISGNCSKHQRALASDIRRARFIALVPFQTD